MSVYMCICLCLLTDNFRNWSEWSEIWCGVTYNIINSESSVKNKQHVFFFQLALIPNVNSMKFFQNANEKQKNCFKMKCAFFGTLQFVFKYTKIHFVNKYKIDKQNTYTSTNILYACPLYNYANTLDMTVTFSITKLWKI